MAPKSTRKAKQPRSRTVEIKLHGGPQLGDLPIAVEVVGRDSKSVWKGAIRLGRTHVLSTLNAGRYAIQANLPSGRTKVKVADLSRKSKARVEFSIGQTSIDDSLAWAAISRPELLNTSEEAASSLRSVWLRLWRCDEHGLWAVDQWPIQQATRVGGVVQYELRLRERLGQYFVQVGGPDTPWRLVALPADDVRVVVSGRWPGTGTAGQAAAHGGGMEPQISLDIATIEGSADVLLAYLSSGQFDQAYEISQQLLAERLLEGKHKNPTAAAVAGYYLLNLRKLDSVHQVWANNLADLKWLPDGAIIDAWYRMRLKEDFAHAGQRLVEAAARGLPVYTRGLRLLLDGLAAFEDDFTYTTPAVSAALKSMRRYGAAADWKALTTTFIGRDPMSPGRLEKGRPDSPEHLVFVIPEDDDLHWAQEGPWKDTRRAVPQPASIAVGPGAAATAPDQDTRRRVARGEAQEAPTMAASAPTRAALIDPTTAARLTALTPPAATPGPALSDVNPPERLIARLLSATDSQSESEQVSGTRPLPVNMGGTEPVQLRGVALERILGTSDLLSISFLERGLAAARAVARVAVQTTGDLRFMATGFLVSPALLLTAAHVIPDVELGFRTSAEFDYQDGPDGRLRKPTAIPCDPQTFFLTDAGLDFTVIALADREAGRRFGWNRLIEDEVKALIGEYLSIVTHTDARPKQVGLRELRILDIAEKFFHCAAAGIAGSSGAPLFNDQWELVGMNRASAPAANAAAQGAGGAGTIMEAVRISRIVKAVRARELSGDQSMLVEEMLYERPQIAAATTA